MTIVRASRDRVAIAALLTVAAWGCDKPPRVPDSGAVARESTTVADSAAETGSDDAADEGNALPTVIVRALSPAESTLVRAIDARVDSIEAYLKLHPGRLEVYAMVADNPQPVPVPDTTKWPEQTETSINIMRDDAGRIVLHRMNPTSESGDWFETISHYFDIAGRTIFQDYTISSFAGGCDILREVKRTHVDSAFTILKEVRTYTDANDKPVDATTCYRRGDDPPAPVRRNTDLPAANARPVLGGATPPAR